MAKSEDYIGKSIIVTYDNFEEEDYYYVVGLDKDDQVVIRRPGKDFFTVSRTWFEREDTGRTIKTRT